MAMWKITSEGAIQLSKTNLKQEHLLEEHLEDWIVTNHALLGERLLVIGRQVMIPDIRDRLDVLAIDTQGNAVIIELKRGKLKDPVEMQAMRYASYIAKWTFEDFESQARAHLGKVGDPKFNFNEIYEQFCAEAGVDEVPDLNSDQRLIIVGSDVKARLGSVALWLREHNIDIKVIEMGVYREGETLLLQPQIIIPVPASRFADIGRPKPGAGGQPWIKNDKSQHRAKGSGSMTSPEFPRLNDLVRDNFEVDGPRKKKNFVGYMVGTGSHNWLAVQTKQYGLKLHVYVKLGRFEQGELAQSLGIEQFDKGDSQKRSLPSSVLIEPRSQLTDRVVLRLKAGFDLEAEAFLDFLKQAYKAFPW